MTTRVAKLASATAGAGVDTVLYTCPANVTTIFKSALVTNQGAGTTAYVLQVHDTAGHVATVRFDAAIGPQGNDEWNGDITLLPGDTINGLSAASGLIYWLSGTRLAGIAP